MAKRERFSTAFKIEEADPNKGNFSGVASMFGSMVDTYPPTRVMKGAFKKVLGDKEQLRRVKVLYQHNPDWPIGKPTELKEVEEGLRIASTISKTSIGQDVLTLMRDGVLDEMSIGFDPVTWRMVKEQDQAEHVRYLDEVLLWEVSIVTFAADARARIAAVHGVQPFQDLPLADIDQAWDAEEAVSRVRKWAGYAEGAHRDYTRFRRAFLHAREDQSRQCRYPIADIIDGQLKAVPRAIFAAATRAIATLDGEELAATQEHLARYYKKLDRLPPWMMDDAARLRSASEWLASLPATAGFGRQAKALAQIAREIRAGVKHPLTARSRQAVAEMITEFQGLLQPAEPPSKDAATERHRQGAVIGQKLRELNLAALEAGILI
jgi:HK97 family phage prohead protease